MFVTVIALKYVFFVGKSVMIWTLLKVIQFYLNNTINLRLLNPALKFGKMCSGVRTATR